MRWSERHACLKDQIGKTPFDRHYIYHTAWAARVLARTRPKKHIDISSYLYFATIVSAFIPIDYFDYRPADIRLPDYGSLPIDLLGLPFDDGSVLSMSCMHVIEHIGLGRYGDPLDPDGDRKALDEMKRVLMPGGDLILVVPVGEPRVIFNAHRIYSYNQIVANFPGFELFEFALVPDGPDLGHLVLSADPKMADEQSYGCGCFWFKKPGLS